MTRTTDWVLVARDVLDIARGMLAYGFTMAVLGLALVAAIG